MLMPAGTNNMTDMFPELSFSLEERAVYCKNQWGIEPRLDWMKISMWGKGNLFMMTFSVGFLSNDVIIFA